MPNCVGPAMKALRLESVSPFHLTVATNLHAPMPSAGEVLIRVRAAAVTPTELSWYPTTHTKDGRPRTNAIPGHEFSGVVAGLGAGGLA